MWYPWAVFVLRYSASFVNWTRDKLRVLDRKTRKYFTTYGALHATDSVARIYLPRKKGGRGLISMQDCVDQAVIGLSSYIAQSNEVLLIAARRGETSTAPRKQAKSSGREKPRKGYVR